MSNYTGLIEVAVSEVPEKWRNNIDSSFFDRKVYIVKDITRKDTGRELLDILNERFVRKQLNLETPRADNRDMWYQAFTRLGYTDLSGDSLQQQISFDGSVKSFCEKLVDFFKVPYWGYVQDELNIKSKARAVAWTIEGKSFLMDSETITKTHFGNDTNDFYDIINQMPFFFIICEKEEVLKSTMRALKDKGYSHGWLGMGTQGFASTAVIRILMEYKKEISDKFYVFVLHDYDLDGIKIYLDMKRWFPCESIGLNSKLIERVGIDMSSIRQKYRGKTGEAKLATIKGAKTMLKEIFVNGLIDNEELKEIRYWIQDTVKDRLELQSLTGHRLDEDMTLNPARDFADYIEDLLENDERIYDLNRYRTPWVDTTYAPSLYDAIPDFIEEITNDLENTIREKINTYLESNNVGSEDDWRAFTEGIYMNAENYLSSSNTRKNKILEAKKDELIEENKEYTESLKSVRTYIRKQDNELDKKRRRKQNILRAMTSKFNDAIQETIENTGEYEDCKTDLEALKDKLMKALEDL